MDEMKSKITALAKLDKTPDEIMAEKRVQFERENAKREQWNKSWWRRFASWRLDALNKDDFREGSIAVSLVTSATLTVLCVFALILGSVEFLGAASGLDFLVLVVNCERALIYDDLGIFTRGLLRWFFFPLMPFLRIADLIILRAENRQSGYYYDRRIAEIQTLKDSSTETVTRYYTQGIEDARKELLGEASELRATEKDLFQRRDRIQRQIQQLAARMGHAKNDPPRKAVLKQAYYASIKRRDRIRSAMERVEETIAKTSAILDECKATVSKLSGPLGDAILLAEIERGSDGDDVAITNAHDAVDAHVEHVRAKLTQLATAVTSPTFALPSEKQEEGLEAYFARVERVAEEVSAIGITPVEKSAT